MLKRLAVLCVLPFVLSTSVVAQNAGDFMNMFGGLMRAAIIEHARAEWSKLSTNETECIEQGLQLQGYSIDVMVQNGIAPQDPRVSGIRGGCRNSTVSLPTTSESANNIGDLSAKPTYDCTRARSATARILCVDQAGAKADWDLASAYWARTFSLDEAARQGFTRTQEDWIQSLNQACQLQSWQGDFSPAQRQCVLVAYRKRTELYRSQLRGEALSEAQLTPEQHAQIQSELVRLGFLNAEADGEFGPQTRAAIKRYQAQSGAPESDFLTSEQRQRLLRVAQASGPSPAQTQCQVNDPTGTPLNLRNTPNGEIVGALNNGVSVRVVQVGQDPRGRSWSLIARIADNQTLGWVYREYVACGPAETPATAAQVAQANTPPPAASQLALASSSELSMKASKLSSDEAARQCQSSDAETRLIGCTAVIDQRGKGISSTIALADALDGRCWAYNDFGQYERALPDCNASIAASPRRYFAYNTLGNSLLGLRDNTKAIAAFTKSIELKSDFVYSHIGRARAFAAAENAEMARADFNYVLTFDPTNQAAKEGIVALDSPPVDNPPVIAGPAVSTSLAETPPYETAKLKEARVFLNDAQKFIAEQKSVPAISAIANEAANLKIALTNFDEAGAVQSMAHLNALLIPISGFAEFEKQLLADRNREDARQLAEATSEGDKNIYFIDNYLRENLGDPNTASLIRLRERISSSQKQTAIDEINKANNSLQTYVNTNAFSKTYERIVSSYTNPTTTKNETPATLSERLGITPKSAFLIDGPADEIALLYNASPSAQSVWVNIRGDIVFQGDTAALCFAQANPEITMFRYIERVLGEQGARAINSGGTPCDLSKVGSSIDVIAFQRGELLKQREDYIRALIRLIEGNSFRRYKMISDYASRFQQREILSLQIERDIENNARKGVGVLTVSDSPAVCVINLTPSEQVDGVKELLRRNQDLVAPKLTSDWQFVETTAELTFRGLQRQQCGYVAGQADDLRTLLQVLRRDQIIKYSFAPVWFEVKDVEQATFDTNDARKQEILKKAEKDRADEAAKTLELKRLKEQQSQKSEIERGLRQKNGVRANGLRNGIHDIVKGLAEKRLNDTNQLMGNIQREFRCCRLWNCSMERTSRGCNYRKVSHSTKESHLGEI